MVRRVVGAIVVVAALVAVLASSASAPAASAKATGAATGRATAPIARAREGSNAAAASAYVRKVLRALPLPAGATQVSTDRSTGHKLGSIPSRPMLSHFIDVDRFYTIAGDSSAGSTTPAPEAVIQAIDASPPQGYTASGTGNAGNVNTGPSLWFVSLTPDHLPAAIFQASVVYSAAATSGGGTALRVDSTAVPLTPRPNWERVPSGAHAVTITAVGPSGGQATRTLGTVTSAAKVKQVIRVIDSLPIVQPGTVIGCPAILSTSTMLRLSFSATAGSTPLAVATETGCDGITFTVGRRTGDPLQESTDLSAWLKQHHVLPAGTVYPSM
jgi:hypothetical protein